MIPIYLIKFATDEDLDTMSHTYGFPYQYINVDLGDEYDISSNRNLQLHRLLQQISYRCSTR